MKRQNMKFLLTLLISMMGFETFAHDIAVKNSDGVTIYYTWVNNNTELAVSYRGSNITYSNEYSGITEAAAAEAVLQNTAATKEEVDKAESELSAVFVEWGKSHASVENPADMTSKIVKPALRQR